MRFILAAILLCRCAKAQSDQPKALWLSIAALSAASAADAATSWHGRELNTILASNGRFGNKAIAIKVGVLVPVIVLEVKLRKHRRLRREAEVVNWAGAGALGAIAWRDR